MATRLNSKSFRTNLLLSVGGLFLLFAVCFSIYQYRRESQFKTDILDATLRAYCYEMVQTIAIGADSLLLAPKLVDEYVDRHHIDGLRITIVDEEGVVLYDTSEPDFALWENHLDRKEIGEAFKSGGGYDIKRVSASTHLTYFYSATKIGDFVVRAAVPYSAELTDSLRADSAYLYFAIALTLLLGLVLYFCISRIGQHIRYLREFAVSAERGEQLDHNIERALPDDELGDICHTITALYWQLRESEEDKTRLKRQLTQNAAHELKTPTSTIHGFLESIIEHPDMPEEKRRHFIERCYIQSERMSNLLRDMTLLTRLDEGQCQNSLTEVVDVADVIRGVMGDVSLQLEQCGIEPVLRIPSKIEVKGDKSLIYSIFRNIVDNTIAYAAGANRLNVECVESAGTGRDENYYEFTICDNGIGVDAEHLPHLFERFYRVDKGRSRQSGGTGLGLAIVKNAIALHGGKVSAGCNPGGGLSISFSLRR